MIFKDYMPAHTTNVNKTRTPIQTAGDKNEPFIVFMRKS